jgi:hypothetical protein
VSFVRSEMAFSPGLYANRSRRASKLRWVDGNLVRFRDGVPAQVGGWTSIAPRTGAVTGLARSMLAYRPNSQAERLLAIGTDQGAFLYDADIVANITPTPFTPGIGSSLPATGFGTGLYGSSTYGTPRPGSTNNLIDASNWSFDMFGQILLGLFSYNGELYKYDRVGADARFIAVAGAPTGRAICMSDERHCFMFGCDGIPGLVRWSDREDYTVWAPLATNRAGSYELQVRSPFQCGVRVRGQILGLTKTEVFAFTPLQNALVYARDRISTEAGVAGPHAIAVVTDSEGETAYWFGPTDFFAYDGLVRTLDCELRDYVFNDVNMLQGSKFSAGVNTQFNEVWFFYCSSASNEIDRGVIYNYADGTWSKATIARLRWQDRGVFANPIAIDAAGTLYTHESGKTANGATMPSFVISHPITIGVGERFADVDQWWPDMQSGSDAAKVSFICRDWPGEDPRIEGPFDFAIGDEFVPLDFSARELQLRIDGNGAWELGLPQISMQGGSLR